MGWYFWQFSINLFIKVCASVSGGGQSKWVESHGQTAFAMCFCGQSVSLLLQLVSMAYSGEGVGPCIVGTYCVYLK